MTPKAVMPLIASILAAIFSGSTAAIAGAEQAIGGTGQFQWGDIIEKGGTIGVLVWVVMMFKSRSEEQDKRNDNVTDRALNALEKSADANKGLAESIDKLRESLSHR